METEKNIENGDSKGGTKSLLFIDFFFIIVDLVIAYLMVRLWLWLFVNRVVILILVVITTLALIKQLWKGVDNICAHWKELKNTS